MGCSIEEAKYYLEEAEWDVEKARELFNNDKEWEIKNKDNFQPASLFVVPKEKKDSKSRKLFSTKSVSAWC